MPTIEEQLNNIESAMPQVYQAGATVFEQGFDKGYALAEVEARQEGYDEGYQAGLVDSEAPFTYDEFWDAYQDFDTKNPPGQLFCNSCWNDITCKPKKPLYLGYRTFAYSNIQNALKNITILGIGSNSQTPCPFASAEKLEYVPEIKIDIVPANYTNIYQYFFTYCFNLKTIEKLHVREDLIYEYTFNACTSLQNLAIEGEIGNSINLSQSPLTSESMVSVISHLVPQKTTTIDKTVSFKSECWDALNADTTIPKPEGFTDWKEYVLSIGWQY